MSKSRRVDHHKTLRQIAASGHGEHEGARDRKPGERRNIAERKRERELGRRK